MINTEYKKLVKHILDNGTYQECRNGHQLIIPSYSFTLDFRSTDHIISLRKMYTRGIIGEFETLVDADNPLTNVKQFKNNGCNYWDKFASEDGSLRLDYYDRLHPQLEDVIENIKKDPYSRRHVISLWHHENVQSDVLSLASCWHNLTFSIINDTLHLTWVQRSVDTMVGLPSDIVLAFMFMQLVSDRTGYKIGTCMFSLSNVHIYEEHIEGAKELLTRSAADYAKPLKFELKE